MKKKIANIVEIVFEITAFVLFATMTGVAEATNGMKFEASFIESLNKLTVFAAIFYAVWILNLALCVASILSKKKTRDNIIHCILPIILALMSDYMVVLMFQELSPSFTIANVIMLLMIIASFVKRSQSVADEVKKVVVVNEVSSDADELKKFKELLDRGVITQEEFEEKKKQLLDS